MWNGEEVAELPGASSTRTIIGMTSYQRPILTFANFVYPKQWYLKLELELSDRIPITTRKYEDLSEVDHGPWLGGSTNRWLEIGSKIC
jgi:hypothetical protein